MLRQALEPTRHQRVKIRSALAASGARVRGMTQSTEYDEGFGPRPNRLTIAEVAESARVSPSTVSKVLNGRADVSANTRDRVERLIREGATAAAAPLSSRAHPLSTCCSTSWRVHG